MICLYQGTIKPRFSGCASGFIGNMKLSFLFEIILIGHNQYYEEGEGKVRRGAEKWIKIDLGMCHIL